MTAFYYRPIALFWIWRIIAPQQCLRSNFYCAIQRTEMEVGTPDVSQQRRNKPSNPRTTGERITATSLSPPATNAECRRKQKAERPTQMADAWAAWVFHWKGLQVGFTLMEGKGRRRRSRLRREINSVTRNRPRSRMKPWIAVAVDIARLSPTLFKQLAALIGAFYTSSDRS